jgi:hypothetical protein
MALDQTYAKKTNDHIHGETSLTMPTGLKCRLMTTVGSASANGTEVATGGGYTSGTGAPAISYSAATTATPSVIATDAAITVTSYPRVETVNGIEIWESTPVRIELGSLTTPRTMAIGDTLSFASGAITSSLQ